MGKNLSTAITLNETVLDLFLGKGKFSDMCLKGMYIPYLWNRFGCQQLASAEYLLFPRDASKLLTDKGFMHKIWDLEMTLFSQVFSLVKQLDSAVLPAAVPAS